MGHGDTDMATLAGVEVATAWKCGDELYLVSPNGTVRALTPYGDCCSNCYVQHVSGADALRSATIATVEGIESEPTPEERENADVLDGWGHRLTTNKGHVSIEMRVDHNGYYGGYLDVSIVDALPVGAVALEDF